MNDPVLDLALWLGRITTVLLVPLVVCFYLLPSIVGFVRRKRNLPHIAFWNVLFGWTGIAWVAMLVESFKRDEMP